MTDRHEAGFKERTRVDAARERLVDAVSEVQETETVPVADADGRVVAVPVEADRPVPHYRRAAMDGFAVRAADTVGASERTPQRLTLADAAGPEAAMRVHTGSEVPVDADAVVPVERARNLGDAVAVEAAVAAGENVAPVGEDVSESATLFEHGDRLGPSDLGLLRVTGKRAVTVLERPAVAVVPTGEELVERDPAPGEVIETNGLTVSRFVERWGGDPRYRDVVTDDRAALRAAIDRDLDADLVVTTGGSSVGERDVVPEVVDAMGEVVVHGVAHKPGHPVGFGVVADTPVLMLPGYPVSCIVNAVQLLRPAVAKAAGRTAEAHPTTEAPLTRKVTSEPGVRTYTRVRLTDEGAEPVRSGGAGVLSSVSAADGWVTVPESVEGYAAGETVGVADWEWSP